MLTENETINISTIRSEIEERPEFLHVNRNEAEKALYDFGPNRSILRNSSLGVNYLAFSTSRKLSQNSNSDEEINYQINHQLFEIVIDQSFQSGYRIYSILQNIDNELIRSNECYDSYLKFFECHILIYMPITKNEYQNRVNEAYKYNTARSLLISKSIESEDGPTPSPCINQ